LDYLSAITLNIPSEWSLARLAFKVKFDKAAMEARTDGYLQGPYGGDEAFAIVEVEPHTRDRISAPGRSLYKQESAEMISWILRDERNGQVVPLPKE
jgi:hypothetical protein